MDDEQRAARLQRRTAYDVAPLVAEAPSAMLEDPSGPAATRLRRLVPVWAISEGPVPEFCAYRTVRGKCCDEVARWRERDGVRGYCHRHRASVGLDDPL